MVTHEEPHDLVKKAKLFWTLDNISNSKLTYNSFEKTLGESYSMFAMLKEIESYGMVSLEANEYDGTCSITSDNAINLKDLGPILGFEQKKKTKHSASMKTKCGSVDINSGLKFMRIGCNIIDKHNNIFMDSKSDTLISLAITSSQTLKGLVQHFLVWNLVLITALITLRLPIIFIQAFSVFFLNVTSVDHYTYGY